MEQDNSTVNISTKWIFLAGLIMCILIIGVFSKTEVHKKNSYTVIRPIDGKSFTIYSSRDAHVIYNLGIECGKYSKGDAYLECSKDNKEWDTLAEVSGIDTSSLLLEGYIPSGLYYVRIETQLKGNTTIRFIKGQERY